MTRSRDVADSQDNLGGAVPPITAGKNAVINGGFDVWQRGTTLSSTSGTLGETFLADRWTNYYFGGGNSANYTVSRQAQTPGAIPGNESPFYVRYAFPAGNATTYWETIHKIEDVRTFAGQTVTISFWSRNSGTQGIAPNIELQQVFGSGGSSSVYYYPGTPPISSAWTRYRLTTTLGGVTGKTIGANSYLQFKLYFGPTAGSVTAFNFDVAGVQIELGSQATPFSRAGGTIQGELAACQRYYWRQSTKSSNYSSVGNGYASTTSAVKFQLKNPVTMRVEPISIDSNGLYANDGASLIGGLTSVTLENANETYLNFTAGTGAGSFTANRPYNLLLTYPTAWIGCSAEL
jgi:hypothetical protein